MSPLPHTVSYLSWSIQCFHHYQREISKILIVTVTSVSSASSVRMISTENRSCNATVRQSLVVLTVLSFLLYHCLNAAMAQRVDDVIHLCRKIADQPEFEKTWKTIRNIKMITAAAGHSMLLFGPQELLVGKNY